MAKKDLNSVLRNNERVLLQTKSDKKSLWVREISEFVLLILFSTVVTIVSILIAINVSIDSSWIFYFIIAALWTVVLINFGITYFNTTDAVNKTIVLITDQRIIIVGTKGFIIKKEVNIEDIKRVDYKAGSVDKKYDTGDLTIDTKTIGLLKIKCIKDAALISDRLDDLVFKVKDYKSEEGFKRNNIICPGCYKTFDKRFLKCPYCGKSVKEIETQD